MDRKKNQRNSYSLFHKLRVRVLRYRRLWVINHFYERNAREGQTYLAPPRRSIIMDSPGDSATVLPPSLLRRVAATLKTIDIVDWTGLFLVIINRPMSVEVPKSVF